MKLNPYPRYIPTEDILFVIPDGWRSERLYDVADIRTSNVDKKTVEGQNPVKLCNYIDVYYNSKIKADIEFMVSTASDNEVERFKLRKGDVVFTKDSEDPFDIGIPAHIEEEIENLICGYHLSIVKAFKNDLFGGYVYYALKSKFSKHQFTLASNGVTRFGLTYQGIKNLRICVPSLSEQEQIANFLDYKTAQIDRLIEKKKQLIEKLNEKRMAVITQAVTKGLDPSVPMKDSGIDWLGEVPERWEVRTLKFCCNFLNNRRIPLSAEERTGMAKNYPYYGASGIIDEVENYIFDEPTVLVAEDGANLLSRSSPLAFEAKGQYWVNNHAHILKPITGPFGFWSNLLCTVSFDPWITGSAQPKLTKENLGRIPLPHPPFEEQEQILNFLNDQLERIDPLLFIERKTISKLEEYRTALITAAVTGKIDVRGVQIPNGETKHYAC